MLIDLNLRNSRASKLTWPKLCSKDLERRRLGKTWRIPEKLKLKLVELDAFLLIMLENCCYYLVLTHIPELYKMLTLGQLG